MSQKQKEARATPRVVEGAVKNAPLLLARGTTCAANQGQTSTEQRSPGSSSSSQFVYYPSAKAEEFLEFVVLKAKEHLLAGVHNYNEKAAKTGKPQLPLHWGSLAPGTTLLGNGELFDAMTDVVQEKFGPVFVDDYPRFVFAGVPGAPGSWRAFFTKLLKNRLVADNYAEMQQLGKIPDPNRRRNEARQQMLAQREEQEREEQDRELELLTQENEFRQVEDDPRRRQQLPRDHVKGRMTGAANNANKQGERQQRRGGRAEAEAQADVDSGRQQLFNIATTNN
eukprot:g14901.t1